MILSFLLQMRSMALIFLYCSTVTQLLASASSFSLSPGIENSLFSSCVPSGNPAVSLYWSECDYYVDVDHFSFHQENFQFPIRYLVNDTWWQPGGAIFFYTGNEGPIEAFASITGVMWEFCPKFSCLLIFAQHRYYDIHSSPFGNHSYDNGTTFQYLTSEQALADFSSLLFEVKKFLGFDKIPIISFGGSYGGVLSAWLRLKYPFLIEGAIAASAPFKLISGHSAPGSYSEKITEIYFEAAEECGKGIQRSWAALEKLSDNQEGIEQINEIFQNCDPPMKTFEDVENWLFPYIATAIKLMAQGKHLNFSGHSNHFTNTGYQLFHFCCFLFLFKVIILYLQTSWVPFYQLIQ
jgi:lysosomal Pro-X carboxypeptidase